MSGWALLSWQSAVLVAVSAAAAVWLFRLRLRPPHVAVASLVLWRRLESRPVPLSWWDRIRRAVSLAVTVLLAVVLAAVVGRAMSSGKRSAGRVLLVMDSSLSMQARTPDGRTRWSRAVAEAKREAAASNEVLVATTADGLIEGPTSDLALVETTLDKVAPHAADRGNWPRVSGVTSVHFFTDGAFERDLDASVIVHSVHADAPNLAITAFGARPATSASASGEAYLEVSNYSGVAQPSHVTVTRGTALIFDRQLSIGAGEALRQIIPIAATGSPRLRAHVSARANALDVDDEAVAWVEAARAVRLVVVSARPDVYTALLGRDPSLTLRTLPPAAYDSEDAAADVFLFDRWLPSTAPSKPSLCVLPPTTGWLGTAGEMERAPEWQIRQDHDVLAGVDVQTIDVREVRAYDSASLFTLAASLRGAPFVAVRDRPDSRLVMLGVPIDGATLRSAVALPVLVGNAVEWLSRPRLAEPGPPGPRVLPSSTTQVTAPDGSHVRLIKTTDSVVVRLDRPGLYLVEVGGAQSVLTVNVNNPALSDLSRTTSRDRAGALAAGSIVGGAWWTSAVIVALVLATIEWWTWQRRLTV